jgi:hypothetical protein
MQLSRYLDLAAVSWSTAASNAIEMATDNCEGVLFVGVPASSAARTWSLALKYGASTSAFVNCASTHTHTSTGAANHVIVTDVYKPAARWLGGTFSSTTATPCYLLAFKYGNRVNTATAFSATGATYISAASGGIKRAVSPTSAT